MLISEEHYRQALEDSFTKEAYVGTLARGAFTLGKGLARQVFKKNVKSPFMSSGWAKAGTTGQKTWAATKGTGNVMGSGALKGLMGYFAVDTANRARKGEISTGRAAAELAMLAGGTGFFAAASKPVGALSKAISSTRTSQAVLKGAKSKSLLTRTGAKTLRGAGKVTRRTADLASGFAAWEVGSRAGQAVSPYKLKSKQAQAQTQQYLPPHVRSGKDELPK